jgi:hypothetical protein
MNLNTLVQARQNITCDIIDILKSEVTNIKVCAEDMIECATNIKGQGYTAFIHSREEFLDKINSLYSQLELSADINRFTPH